MTDEQKRKLEEMANAVNPDGDCTTLEYYWFDKGAQAAFEMREAEIREAYSRGDTDGYCRAVNQSPEYFASLVAEAVKQAKLEEREKCVAVVRAWGRDTGVYIGGLAEEILNPPTETSRAGEGICGGDR